MYAKRGAPVTAVDVRLDHLAIATHYAATEEQWPVAPRFNPVDRWYHRLAVADDHEVWVLTWLPGQGTDLHDHGGSAGAFHVVSGTLTEDTVASGPSDDAVRLSARELSEGTGRRFGTRHIHRITNRSGRPAISVHVYGPALATMTRYQLGPAGLRVATVETAGVQW
jgi:Cysteine dioxygenase type I